MQNIDLPLALQYMVYTEAKVQAIKANKKHIP
jgi:hypothetical protein